MSESLADLSRALGLELVDSKVQEQSNFTFALRIKNLVQPYGFEVRVQQSLMSTKAQLFLDSFPGDLLTMCKSSFANRKEEIESVIMAAESSGISAQILVDGRDNYEEFKDSPWEALEVTLHKKFENYEDAANCLKLTVMMIFSIMIPLITEESENLLEEVSVDYQEEGRKTSAIVNKYERSRVNRAIALEIHGFVCAACGLRMADLYGPIGEGVIHVHHLQPISSMEVPRVLNPVTDLIPLCPNCHTVVHRTNPPLSIPQLQEAIRK
jgi:5-methylcytosine-specific restriction protein A